MSTVHVFEIPEIDKSFPLLFAGGIPVEFKLVDWFQDPSGMLETETGRADLEKFIRNKRYFKPGQAYLVLDTSHTFTIGYHA